MISYEKKTLLEKLCFSIHYLYIRIRIHITCKNSIFASKKKCLEFQNMAVILFNFAQICNKKSSLIISWFNNIGCHVLLVISRGRDSYMNLFIFYSVTGVSVYCFFGLTNILSFLICQSFAPINSLSCPCFMELSVYNYEKGYIYESSLVL